MSPIVKRKKEKFHLPSNVLLIILTILCIGLILLTITTDIVSAPLNRAIGTVITPFQSGISYVGEYLSDRKEELASIRSLLAENEELKKKVDELTTENILLSQDRYELTHLRELYSLDENYAEYEKVGARVIASDGGNWFSGFIIDKGSNDGILVNMNVIADGGLVGKVTYVAPSFSKVSAIIADNANVSGMILNTQDTLIVSGSLELMEDGVISFSQLKAGNENVHVGDKIVTSYISDIYLPDILIGYVDSITEDSNNLSLSGLITPAVDFEHLSTVLVITRLKQSVIE